MPASAAGLTAVMAAGLWGPAAASCGGGLTAASCAPPTAVTQAGSEIGGEPAVAVRWQPYEAERDRRGLVVRPILRRCATWPAGGRCEARKERVARGGECRLAGPADPCRPGPSEAAEGALLPDRLCVPELDQTPLRFPRARLREEPRADTGPPGARTVRAAPQRRWGPVHYDATEGGPLVFPAVLRICQPWPECRTVYHALRRGERTRSASFDPAGPGRRALPADPRAAPTLPGPGPQQEAHRAAVCASLVGPALTVRPLDDPRAKALAIRLVLAYNQGRAPELGARIATLLSDELPRLHAAGSVSEGTLLVWDKALARIPLEAR